MVRHMNHIMKVGNLSICNLPPVKDILPYYVNRIECKLEASYINSSLSNQRNFDINTWFGKEMFRNVQKIEWVKSMVWKGNVQKIVDPSLQGNFDINTAWKVVELAMSCVHNKSIKRPTMNDVVMELDNCLTLENGFHGTRANDLNVNMSLNLESMRDPNLR
ncbi:leucine-rich repeat transmembrane protein kinase protein [Tanacetum coccineum]